MVTELGQLPATISAREAARLLGCSAPTVYDAVRRGDLEAVKVGEQRIRILVQPLRELIKVSEADMLRLLIEDGWRPKRAPMGQ